MASASAALAQLGSPFGGTPDAPHASLRLAIGSERLTPGEGRLAVVFTIDEQWHLYWKNPGDTGLPPTLDFTLPDGIVPAGPLEWPAPRRYMHGQGQLLDYIYEGEVALLLPVRVDPSLVGRTVEVGVSGEWLVCREECLPGDGSATLAVTVSEDAGAPSASSAVIGESEQKLPVGMSEVGVTARWEGLDLIISAPGADRLEFFALAPEVGGPEDLIGGGASLGDELRLRYDISVTEAAAVEAVVGVTRGRETRYAELRIETAATGK